MARELRRAFSMFDADQRYAPTIIAGCFVVFAVHENKAHFKITVGCTTLGCTHDIRRQTHNNRLQTHDIVLQTGYYYRSNTTIPRPKF
jgi:hypothetical protein